MSSSTPPDIAPSTTFDSSRELEGFPTLPSNAPSNHPGLSMGLGSNVLGQDDDGHTSRTNGHAFHQSAGRLTYTDPRYRQHADAPSLYAGPSGFRHPMSMSAPSTNDFVDQGYWRQGAVGSPGDYAPFPFDSTTTPTAVRNPYAFMNQPTNLMWPPSQQQQHQQQPVRSMSYGQIEGYAQNMGHYGDLQLGGLQQSSELRHIPPTLETHAVMMAQAPGHHSAPIAQHAQSFMSQQNTYGMQQSPFQPAGSLPTTTQGYSGAYYDSSPQLSALHEEQSGSPGGLGRYTQHSSQPG